MRAALAEGLAAHAMFELPLFQASTNGRTGMGQWISEIVATFGLVLVVLRCGGQKPWSAPLAVGAYIAAASGLPSRLTAT